MKKEDRVAYFLDLAITNPDNLGDAYFFCLDQENDKLIVKKEICDEGILLPRLSFDEKLNFLKDFAKKLEGEDAEKFNSVLLNFDSESKFIRKIEQKLVELRMLKTWDFVEASSAFLHSSENRLYAEFNISPDMEVDFGELQSQNLRDSGF